jgi:hypothetical protein
MCVFLRYLPCSELSMNTVQYIFCTCIGCIFVHVLSYNVYIHWATLHLDKSGGRVCQQYRVKTILLNLRKK